MKGDVASDVACPRCGKVLHPRFRNIRIRNSFMSSHSYATPRKMIREAMNQHAIWMHPELSPRERSLLADEAYETITFELSQNRQVT